MPSWYMFDFTTRWTLHEHVQRTQTREIFKLTQLALIVICVIVIEHWAIYFWADEYMRALANTSFDKTLMNLMVQDGAHQRKIPSNGSLSWMRFKWWKRKYINTENKIDRLHKAYTKLTRDTVRVTQSRQRKSQTIEWNDVFVFTCVCVFVCRRVWARAVCTMYLCPEIVRGAEAVSVTAHGPWLQLRCVPCVYEIDLNCNDTQFVYFFFYFIFILCHCCCCYTPIVGLRIFVACWI